MGKQSANQEEGDDGIIDKPGMSHLHEVFADNVTLHGYRYLFDSNSSVLRRVVWCVVFGVFGVWNSSVHWCSSRLLHVQIFHSY